VHISIHASHGTFTNDIPYSWFMERFASPLRLLAPISVYRAIGFTYLHA